MSATEDATGLNEVLDNGGNLQCLLSGPFPLILTKLHQSLDPALCTTQVQHLGGAGHSMEVCNI